MKQTLIFSLLICLAALASGWATDETVTIPAGTELSIRSNQAIDSNTASENQTYSAEVQEDVMGASGEVLIPKGSDATLILRQVTTGGTTGSPELVLDLDSVKVHGQRYVVSTADLQQTNNQGLGKNKRTGVMVGGGAALGTILGAVAGGGKGAVIGAIAGAAAGGTAQVLTRGKEVKVPAETVLKFKLDQPLRLQAAS